MMDDLLEQNRELSRVLGWVPSDWGVHRFDEALAEAIRAFQREHVLDETGLGDVRTYRALLSYRRGLVDGEPDRVRAANLVRLGTVIGYDENDPRILRSAPFAGRTVWVDHPLAAGDALFRGAEGIALTDPVWNLPSWGTGGAHRLIAWRFLARIPWTDGRLAAARAQGADGLVVSIDAENWAIVVEGKGAPLTAFLDALEAHGNPPRAVSVDLQAPGSSIESRRAWGICRRFDAALPPIPGARAGAAMEEAVGLAIAEWSIFAKMRPTFAFPVYTRHATSSTNEVHRLRAWNTARGIRGVGLGLGVEGEVAEAFWAPLPEGIERFDGVSNRGGRTG